MKNLLNVNVVNFFDEMAQSDQSETLAMVALSHLFSANYWDNMLKCKDGTYDETAAFYRKNVTDIACTSAEACIGRLRHHLKVFGIYTLKLDKRFAKRANQHLVSYLTKDQEGEFVISELRELADTFVDNFEETYGDFEEFEKMVSREIRDKLAKSSF